MWSTRKIATVALTAAAAVVAIPLLGLAANTDPDYDRPPTPDDPVRLKSPSASAVPDLLGAVPPSSAPPSPRAAAASVTQVPTGTPTAAAGGEPVDVRDRYYATCSAARSAGAAPLRRGRDDGYRRALDRDGDGVACD